MHRLLLEGIIVVLLVLIGISVFVPSEQDVMQNVIVDFEESIESGDVIVDGEIENVEISEENTNFISNLNSKIANTLVNGLNSIFEIGMKLLRKVIN